MGFADAEVGCDDAQQFALSATLTNSVYLRVRQFGHWVSLALIGDAFRGAFRPMCLSRLNPVAALCITVSDVLSVGPIKDVVRVAAGTVVAGMAAAIRKIVAGKLFGNPVCADVGSVQPELAVAVREAPGQPRPAIIGAAHVNLDPEAGHIGWSKIERHCGLLFRGVALRVVDSYAGAFPKYRLQGGFVL